MRTVFIIVPVYNAEASIGLTLDNLLHQTYGHIEVVCVDDGSTDGSLALLEEYAHRDARVSVISQPNQGVSSARNTGLSYVLSRSVEATNDIVMFVDADDKLVNNACSEIVAAFDEHGPDMMTFGIVCDPPEAAPASLKRELSPANKVYEPFSQELLFKEKSRPYACRSALSCSFMAQEGIRFEPGIKLGEDQVFYFETYPFSRKTVLSSKQLYIYTMNQSSATHQERLIEDKLDQHLMVIEAIVRIWIEKNFRDERCMQELLEWVLDFLMLDVAKLPIESQRRVWNRMLESMRDYLGKCEDFAFRLPTKRCLKSILSFAAGSSDASVNLLDLSAFYLMRRGPILCIERVLMKLGLIK